MSLWDKCQAIYEEIDDLDTEEQQSLIENIVQNGDPNNLYEELTEKQVRWVHWMYRVYVLGAEDAKW